VLTKRIIACLDVDAGRVVKGIQFVNLRDAGDPAELAAAHAESGADEIVLLDITATHENRGMLLDAVRRTARQLFIPFTVGGGIRSLSDAAAVFDAGAEKVSINSAAVADPSLITCIAERFGSQAVVVAIDAKARQGDSIALTSLSPRSGERGDRKTYEVFLNGGRKPTGRDVVEWAREAESRGAGEILLTSMDRDGTRAGFDCDLTAAVSGAVSIPVIASGGAGSVDHFAVVFREGQADAALAASIFHFGIHDIAALKKALADSGIPMRWPC
jgi:cyclase